jgi:hypothetical protein
VPAREQQHIARRSVKALNDAIGAPADVVGRLASGTSVAKKVPIRMCASYLGARLAFVFTVVPFHEQPIDFGNGAESCQLACVGGAQQGTGEHAVESLTSQSLAKLARFLLAPLGQRQVGEACMLPGNRPGRFAMSHQAHDW